MSRTYNRQTAGNRGHSARFGLRAAGNDQPLAPRKTSWALSLSLVLLVLVASAFVIPNRQAIAGYLNRPVEVVRIVTPLNRVAESEVTRLLAAYMHEGFFDTNVVGVKQQLESHPWIARAEVKRVWPDRLALTIVEELAIARWGEASLLNQYGQVFTPSRLEDTASLPLLSGPEGSEAQTMRQFQALSQLLLATGLRIEQLALSDRHSWELVVSGGTRIVVGKTDVREKIKRFVAIYDKQEENDIADIERIDLRYNNGFSVKKKQPEFSELVVR
ncbi:MAG: cell division protein FtsQ/DivIB [Gammaproteobacteria bacterium]|nr:cell division protein FtsQ/DivIB [Gammaproteobacteria bacterium]